MATSLTVAFWACIILAHIEKNNKSLMSFFWFGLATLAMIANFYFS